jgi:sulfide:quinone oxidoreductase
MPRLERSTDGNARPACSVFERLLGIAQSGGPAGVHSGTGSCYIEFGAGRIGRVDIDFLSGPSPTGTYQAPSVELRAEKHRFGASRRARWFGRTS